MAKRITIRLSEEDFRALEQQAKKANLTISEVLRNAWKSENDNAALTEFLEKMENQLNEIEQRLTKRIGTYKRDNGDILNQMAGAITQILNK